MRTTEITKEERAKAFASVRKPEITEKQNLDVRYHIEDFDVNDRPRRFLEAFAAGRRAAPLFPLSQGAAADKSIPAAWPPCAKARAFVRQSIRFSFFSTFLISISAMQL